MGLEPSLFQKASFPIVEALPYFVENEVILLLPVRNRILTLIEREDDTRS
jgi:hypothetical protein